jgi:L-fuconolactonase
MNTSLFALLLTLTVGRHLSADETPPILDCTGPKGADAATVIASQKAWAKYLGETSHEKSFPLDAARSATIDMILVPPGKYFRGDEKSPVVVTLCTENNFLNPGKVGSRLPNAFGIYDMAGNVPEWCADVWKKDFVETQAIDNRGNAWDSAGRSCRATGRGVSSQTYGGSQLGFRVAWVAHGNFVQEKPTLEIIDAHVHFFDPLRPTAPSRPKTDKPLPKPILPEDLKKIAQPLGAVGAIVVEASPLLEDNQWWLDLAAKDPFVIGVVGRLDPASDEFEKNLRRFAGNPRFRGIRITHNELKAGLNGNLVNRLKLLVDLNLALDVLGGPDTPADVARLAAELPKLRIVIDHAANLRIDGNEPPKSWRDGMAAAAKHRNVSCKVSALVEQTGRKQAPRDVKHYRPVLDSLWTYFGEDRLIFGSNWPISNGGAPYETVVGIVRDYFAEKGDRAAAKFFLENAKAVYALQK